MKILFSFIMLLLFSLAGAQNTSLLRRAEAYYSTHQYSKAIPVYEKYFAKNNMDPALLHWADCYRKTGGLKDAEEVFKKYLDRYEYTDSLIIIYADILKQLNKYSEAKEWYLKVWKDDNEKEIFKKYATLCDTSLKSLQSPSSFYVKNLESVNTAYSEITPVEYPGGIVFSSNREGILIERKTRNTDSPLYDIYIATGSDSLFPDKVNLFSSEVNTIHHECCATFTADFRKIFFTRSYDRPYSNSPGSKNSLKMYSAIRVNSKWDSLHTFIFNDTTRSYGHPSVEGNEEMFFFASDMEGGYGGTDIYVCFNVDGHWTNPINMGPFVNSPFNELYPFYHSDGTLYFSSNRPESMGGYDIFMSFENEEGEYALIKNPGWPINSNSNDISIYWDSKKEIGYFSSNRAGGKGAEDIYLIKSLIKK